MSLKLPCPKCDNRNVLKEPLPPAGAHIKCTACAADILVSYPPGAIEKLKAKGVRFAERDVALPPAPAAAPPPKPHSERAAGRRVDPFAPEAAPTHVDPRAGRVASDRAPTEVGTQAGGRRTEAYDARPTEVDPTLMDAGGPTEYTLPASRTPDGSLPVGLGTPEAPAYLPDAPEPTSATELDEGPVARELDDPEKTRAPKRRRPSEEATVQLPDPRGKAKAKGKAAAAPPAKRGCLGRLAVWGGAGLLVTGVLGGVTAGGGYYYYSRDLPTIEALQAYNPPTVTVVYDKDGELLGEIYEERRYVVPFEQIPDHVKNAYISAEDAAFYTHGGVDFMGLARAMMRNLAAGRMAQGASTITQQVTRNFLLTRDKKIERKIKEIILSWRIEEAYSKEHILWLYLNEIYLGSGAYGVEAASRVYFDKHVQDLTVAEAAILAGLPQRPSDYSPHRNFPRAKQRQKYVLDQMLKHGHITNEQHAAALAEEVKVTEKKNEFLATAPHFTEYVRRYLVDKYGHQRVYKEGLVVKTTCDLELQRVAQEAVTSGVFDTDQRMGFRRAGIEHLGSKAEIDKRRASYDEQLRKAWAKEQDPAGRVPVPEKAVLVPGQMYEGVLLEVTKSWARVAIGNQEGVIPIAWSDWVYDPDPRRSWRYRTATDLTAPIDTDDDNKPDTPILQVGDVVRVRLEGLSTQEAKLEKVFKNTPGASKAQLAVRLWPEPEVESALLSFDLETGAVRAMVGGANYEKSEFNRALQSYRQVGSTFKPLVYAAAIESRKITAASMVTDGPLAFSTDQDFIWKPANYGDDYMGNITLRNALAASRNTCTVRVLEAIDPGMNDDVIYKFARRLGIGGPPAHMLPPDHVPTPKNDHLCPWTRETPESTICMDRLPPKDPNISNTRHRQLMKPEDEYWCRSCDLSMGLGSASLTMAELMRAYSAFPTGGLLVEPYYIEEVSTRKGEPLEKHEKKPFEKVMEPEVASITTWLLEGVVQGGTASAAQSLGVRLGGKTGTTNDEKDAWFVGFSHDVITAVWVGYDTPRPLGVSSTGGRTALPIWMKYMAQAAPKGDDRPFPMRGEIEWAQIDESSGRRVTSGGRAYPFIKDTAPESTGVAAGQISTGDPTEL